MKHDMSAEKIMSFGAILTFFSFLGLWYYSSNQQYGIIIIVGCGIGLALGLVFTIPTAINYIRKNI